jgi:predicted transcriptional regulator of viral defense system
MDFIHSAFATADSTVLSTHGSLNCAVDVVFALRDNATLERMERGLYRLADARPLGNPDLVTVALKVPQGVVSLISALAFHSMTTQVHRHWRQR